MVISFVETIPIIKFPHPILSCDDACWETESARPSPLVPVKSNLIVIPTSLPECFLADLEVSSCSKISFLLNL